MDAIAHQVIGAAFRVHNTLGFGFLESVYEKCLLIELHKVGLKPEQQVPIDVVYEDKPVGHFVADLVINQELIVEVKSVASLAQIHEVQLVNYLAATGIETGLLINFGQERVQVKRKFRTARG